MTVQELLFALVVIWIAARLLGEAAERLNQPAVLGELFAGVLVGSGGLGWIDPTNEVLHLLAELGVLILLFEIGLETQLNDLLRVGGASTAVAVTGVVLPLVGGYLAGIAVGADPLLALFLGATFTATSVGVTARVLRDLGQLTSTEARVILGAAVIDDVLGLLLLTLITAVLSGGHLSAVTVLRIVVTAVAFLALALVIGRRVGQRAIGWVLRLRGQGVLIPAAMALAFGLALGASLAGTATILGAFTAGLILAETDRRVTIEKGIRPVGQLFVPIFFVVVGAQVDLRAFNPLDSGNWTLIAAVLGMTLLAILTKWAAGVAPFWIKCRKSVIGAGMIPRGEVGLIFAQVGRSSGLLSAHQFAAVVLIVMLTTFTAPILLRRLLGKAAVTAPEQGRPGRVEELVGGVD